MIQRNLTLSYSTVIEVTDFGACVTKLIIDLGKDKTVSQGEITKDTFTVDVTRYQENGKDRIMIHDPADITFKTPDKVVPLSGGTCIVTNAYVSDENGNLKDKSNFVTLDLKVAPDYILTSAIYSKNVFIAAWSVNKFTITQKEDIKTSEDTISGIRITNHTGDIKKMIDDFKTGSYTCSKDDITLTFASYTPKEHHKKRPLIIWLHGMGEGGTDPTIPIAGNKACNFASKQIQNYFDGAYVLAPQCPTFWMEGKKNDELSKNCTENKTLNSTEFDDDEFGNGTSKYEDALVELINDYILKNDDIDKDRIYIGGDSNGGYMTMLMIRDYGDLFAAAMPTCEALIDSLITDEDINKLKDIPIWFTASKTDTTVPINDYVVPTYNRLVKAGAKNIHFSLFEKIVDSTGLYKNNDGSPYEYLGHFSWIKVYNNECTDIINGKTTTIMEWLSCQSKYSK